MEELWQWATSRPYLSAQGGSIPLPRIL